MEVLFMHWKIVRRSLLLPAVAVFTLLTTTAARGDGPAAESAAETVAGAEIEGQDGAGAAVRVQSDVLFAQAEGIPLRCDIYLPSVPSESDPRAPQPSSHDASGLPAVVLVHGGGWAAGDKWTTRRYARALAQTGMVAVTINYRHAPTHKFPAQLDDVRAALAWLGSHADQYGIDTDRVGMFGYSAGGHLTCMIGTLADAEWSDIEATTNWDRADPRWKSIPPLRAIVSGGSPCEFRDLPIDNTAVAYFLGDSRRNLPDVYLAASPTAHASAGDVPTLFIHGTRDVVVPLASSRSLFEAQRAAGVCSEYLPLDGPGHMLTYLHPSTTRAAVGFLTDRLNRGATGSPTDACTCRLSNQATGDQ